VFIFSGLLSTLAYQPQSNEELLSAVGAWCSGDEATHPDIGAWNVSLITNMSALFASEVGVDDGNNDDWVSPPPNCVSTFNESIDAWDTSRVTTFEFMFYGAHDFNQNISGWNTSSVRSTNGMFNTASSFNQDLSAWDVGQFEDASYMFFRATSFNSELLWSNMTATENLAHMFDSASSYDKQFCGWGFAADTTNTTDWLKDTDGADYQTVCGINPNDDDPSDDGSEEVGNSDDDEQTAREWIGAFFGVLLLGSLSYYVYNECSWSSRDTRATDFRGIPMANTRVTNNNPIHDV
jgi:surface protein